MGPSYVLIGEQGLKSYRVQIVVSIVAFLLKILVKQLSRVKSLKRRSIFSSIYNLSLPTHALHIMHTWGENYPTSRVEQCLIHELRESLLVFKQIGTKFHVLNFKWKATQLELFYEVLILTFISNPNEGVVTHIGSQKEPLYWVKSDLVLGRCP